MNETIQGLEQELEEINAKIEHHHGGSLDSMGVNPAGDIGGIRSRSAKKKKQIFDRYTREAKQAVELYRQRDRILSAIKYHEQQPARDEQDLRVLDWFDNHLKAGDTYTPGNNELVIVRKSKQSITTQGGTRWSIGEVTGLTKQRIEYLRTL